MSAENPVGMPINHQSLLKGIIIRFLQLALVVIIQAALLFISAGDPGWPEGWVYIGLYLVMLLIGTVTLLPRDPGLVAERGRVAGNAKGWDKFLSIFYGLASFSILIVAGLNARFGWPPLPPLLVQLIGTTLFILGYGLVLWAMASNSYFSSYVRIQSDRGHKVASGGPYGIVRHPGYVGMSVSTLGTPLLLGSLWALVPALILICLIAIRTSLEDRTLQKELDGYKAYANRVKYRLVPGVW